MRTATLVLVAAASIAGVAHAQDVRDGMELKGLTLGAPMTDCPSDTVERTERAPEIMCRLGPTTLANQPVRTVVISIFEGRLASAMFFMQESGRYAHATLRDALAEKFGQPDRSKAHVNEYTWRRGPELLHLDGWKGHVLMYDMAEHERIRRIKRDTGKKDL